MVNLPLRGVRFHLSGSIPSSNHKHESSIKDFVVSIVGQILSDGGTVLHGSHPSITPAVITAATKYVTAGGSPESTILVRAPQYAKTEEQHAEIDIQRKVSIVQIIPTVADTDKPLVEMRRWMADRSDVVIVVGGKWWDNNKTRAGIPKELEASLQLGKPGFICAGFGGAAAGYLSENPNLLKRLKNGLSQKGNKEIATETSPTELATKIITQVKLLPLIKRQFQGGRMNRVLSLDGGGLRGVFTAAVLAKWSDMLGENGGTDLIKHFDLVSGTSTGSFLAIGLGLGLTPHEILEFYKDDGPDIFIDAHWKGSKYDSEKLKEKLQDVLSKRKLAESQCRLVIPTVNALHGKAKVIVTPHHPDRVAHQEISAVDAALASSAAPTYFDEAYVDNGLAKTPYLDGGIWANNPVLPAIAEGTGWLDWDIDRIDVLSVGTLASETDFKNTLGGGKITWAMSVTDLFFAAQESAASMLADQLLTKSRHLRVNQQTPNEIGLDNVEAIESMIQRGTEVGANTFASVRSRFLDGYHATDWRTSPASTN